MNEFKELSGFRNIEFHNHQVVILSVKGVVHAEIWNWKAEHMIK